MQRRRAVAASGGGGVRVRYDEQGRPAAEHRLWCTTLHTAAVLTRSLVPFPVFAVGRLAYPPACAAPAPLAPLGGLRVGLVGSHGRWKRPCLQTAHVTI
jgi:hypothetical protein